MASFVLVHGSTQSARDWQFEHYASAIAGAIDSPGAIVVGHSASGTFLPLVPSIRDCRLLVFLAAVIPAPRRSVRDQMLEDPGMFSASWLQAGPRWRNEAERCPWRRLSRPATAPCLLHGAGA